MMQAVVTLLILAKATAFWTPSSLHVGSQSGILKAPVVRSAVSSSTSSVSMALEKTTLRKGNEEADVYNLGACITSYKVDGHDYLFVRPDAKLDGSKPISGGVPFCWPQFGPGEIQQHGFARNFDWETTGSSESSVTMELKDSPETHKIWPHKFNCVYTVELTGGELVGTFAVHNTDDKPFSFTGALHSYFSVSDIHEVEVKGDLQGAEFLDKTENPPATKTFSEKSVTVSKPVDYVFFGKGGKLSLVDSKDKRQVDITNSAEWADTVVWNPYGDKNMGADNFICVESARVKDPVELAPGAKWEAKTTISPRKL